MNEAASKLMRHGDEIANVSVSVDGTLQKRYGHNSLLDASFIISVDNGLVLDYVNKSKTSQVCKKEPRCFRSLEEATQVCEINHTQSSGMMEKKLL